MKPTFVMLVLSAFIGLTISVYRKHFYVAKYLTWPNARKYCREHYDDLSTASDLEIKLLAENAPVNSKFFIGLYRDPAEETMLWKWSTGEPAIVESLNTVELSTYTQCGAVERSNAKLVSYRCSWALPFYCMKVYEVVLIQQENTWEEALKYCRQNYTDLAVLSLDMVMDVVIDGNNLPSTDDDVWIGLRFLIGQWFWVNGDPMGFKLWYPAFWCPSVNQRCGVYDTKRKALMFANCQRRLKFLCLK